ncbi:RNA-binding protein 45 [Lethenteron reissneri]|uniref:RNA-binding protein 45 n=1 Tax=Lethenteron reissneri TaxID=7753 RepID=UPI002AB6D586|nr:RNA-binding protein 45 [Lethenteron reissneri]
MASPDRDVRGSHRGYHAMNLDDPPNSRLFLVVSKTTSEADIREKFSRFGELQDLWIVKDKHTKEHKGIAFIKYARASEACRAMEEMNGQPLSGDGKPIKAMVAQSRASNNHRDLEDEDLTRIFLMIPKTYAEEDLRENFQEYGDIEYCSILKDKNTKDSKGFGYVRFLKPSQAALAIENCDKRFKAILADPKNRSSQSQHSHMEHAHGGYPPYGGREGYSDMPRMQGSFPPSAHAMSGDFTHQRNATVPPAQTPDPAISRCLSVAVAVGVTKEQMLSLFGIIPGLEYCDVQRDPYTGYRFAYLKYNNPASAIYAREKLNRFEYPPGFQLTVNFIEDAEAAASGSNPLGMMALQLVTAQMMATVASNYGNMAQGVPQQAFNTPKMGMATTPTAEPQYLNFKLPPRQPLASQDSEMKERLFLVFSGMPPSQEALTDVFCRYGNLIEVYVLPQKNYGYAKFADGDCAKDAMDSLHGQEVCGVKMKVLPADPPKDEARKRQRTN